MESRRCLVSGRTDSITRWSLPALLTLPAIALRLIRRDELGCVEVVQTINALGVAVLHQEHRARTIPRPRETRPFGASSMVAPTPQCSQAEFRILCRVHTASPPLGASFPDYKTGGNAAVLSRR